MIDFNIFLSWAENKFDNVIVKGDEIRLNSIFVDDSHNHLYCNPYGGKYKRKDGCYHCFKTGKNGTLIGLVMLVENCSYQEAKEILSEDHAKIGNLEKLLDEFFKIKTVEKSNINLILPENTILINETHTKAVKYLINRKIPYKGLYYCNSGKYKNRIIIPYYDKLGNLIYFNSRLINTYGIRYLGPPKTTGIGKSDVIYFTSYPKLKSKIYLTEGEFDAITLNLCGFYSAACGGKELSDSQIIILKDYEICLALDNDKYGFNAIIKMGEKLLKFGIKTSYVLSKYKDWNEMLKKTNQESVKAFIDENEQIFDPWSSSELSFSQI